MTEIESFLATVAISKRSRWWVMMRFTPIMGHEIGQARAEELANVVAKSSEIIECGRRAAANMPSILAGHERLKARQVAPQTPQVAAQTI
jgi:hypothetical protein